ncbi:hypothetical protein N0V83_006467 [Neocucurbitaria cava]|uniref:Uncharacterized protein n=1 Tax=Neocucurbitaria cava TaxID=798079 RepID=A0A9W8Y692_9PLEO|nr:hypothetical protein N0V83_006467 [Neocucurbitaria cava]
MLCRRVGELCQFIEASGLQIPAMQADEEAVLQRILTTVGVSHDNLTAGQRTSPGTSKTNKNAIAPLQLAGVSGIADDIHGAWLDFDFDGTPQLRGTNEMQAISDFSQASAPMANLLGEGWESISAQEQIYGASYSSQLGTDVQNKYRHAPTTSELYPQPLVESSISSGDDISDSESVEEIVHILSDRMGSLQIGAEGQIRYYGPTSDFSLLNMPSTDPLHIHRSIRSDGQDYLDRLDVGAEVPPELEEHLVNLYFTWQDASFHIVDREMYEMGKVKWHRDMQDTSCYSEALRNAM